jgi:hypothetical protein
VVDAVVRWRVLDKGDEFGAESNSDFTFAMLLKELKVCSLRESLAEVIETLTHPCTSVYCIVVSETIMHLAVAATESGKGSLA